MTQPISRVYANHGRWIVECSQCHTAVECSTVPTEMQHKIGAKRWMCPPTWGGCGAVFAVGWPDIPRISAILKPRAKKNQNWMPGEPLTKLVADNIEHGVAVPESETGA